MKGGLWTAIGLYLLIGAISATGLGVIKMKHCGASEYLDPVQMLTSTLVWPEIIGVGLTLTVVDTPLFESIMQRDIVCEPSGRPTATGNPQFTL